MSRENFPIPKNLLSQKSGIKIVTSWENYSIRTKIFQLEKSFDVKIV